MSEWLGLLPPSLPKKIWMFHLVILPVCLRIQSECGKMRTRITPNTDTFYAVDKVNIFNKSGWGRHFQQKNVKEPFCQKQCCWSPKNALPSTGTWSPEKYVTGIPSSKLFVVRVPVEKKQLWNLKKISDAMTFFNSSHKKWIARYIGFI